MSLYTARQILDAARAGAPVPERLITAALILTGDLPENIA